ncbi:MAG: hypothetical protein JO144_12110, partial [Actinobacteria bacterium]|nr:hypothetical protein [Actinomycetota bacterium]
MVALLLVLALVQRPDRPAPTRTARSGSADVAAVLTVLNRHAGALLHRDSAAWAADLDGSAAAAGYAGRQRQVFADLAQVPLDTWRYVLVAPVTDPTVLDAA